MNNIDKAEERLKEIENKIPKNCYGYIEGFDFALFIQDLLISENGYVLDTGNWENVNYVCAYKLLENIKKHPKIWKYFFMIV